MFGDMGTSASNLSSVVVESARDEAPTIRARVEVPPISEESSAAKKSGWDALHIGKQTIVTVKPVADRASAETSAADRASAGTSTADPRAEDPPAETSTADPRAEADEPTTDDPRADAGDPRAEERVTTIPSAEAGAPAAAGRTLTLDRRSHGHSICIEPPLKQTSSTLYRT